MMHLALVPFDQKPLTLHLDPRTQIAGFSVNNLGHAYLALLAPNDAQLDGAPRTFVLCSENDRIPTPIKQIVGMYYCPHNEVHFIAYEAA